MCKGEIDHLLTDTRYALRQLRQFREVDRAIDALERIEAKLEAARETMAPDVCDEPSAN